MQCWLIKHLACCIQWKLRFHRENPGHTDHASSLEPQSTAGAQAEWTSLEASRRVTWTGRWVGLLHHTLSWKGEVEIRGAGARSCGSRVQPRAGRLQPTERPDYVQSTEEQRRTAAWPLPNWEWEILGSEAGAGLCLPDPLGSWRPGPRRSTSPKAVYTQGWECLFFLIDFLQINPWPAERGSEQQLFTRCL